MTAPEAASTLVELTRLEAQVVELKARVAAHADEVQVGIDVGATSTANWLAHQTQQTRTAASGVVRLGYDLSTYDRVRAGLAAGDLRPEQARVIITAVRALPNGLDPDLIIRAEEHLVQLASDYDAKALRILGNRLMEVIAPDLADAYESDRLEKEEAKAAQAARLTMTDDGHGKVHGRFTLPTLQAAELKKMLLALAAPKHLAATEGPGVERRPGPERMGRAFMELIDRISAKDLPKVGRSDATIVVTIDLDTLTRTPAEGRGPRHRRTHLRHRCPTPGVHRPDHPRRPRRRLRGPRPRQDQTVLHQSPDHRHEPARRRLRHRRLRLATLDVPRPPLDPLGPTAARPTSTRADSSAPDTTPEPTTRRTRCTDIPTAR